MLLTTLALAIAPQFGGLPGHTTRTPVRDAAPNIVVILADDFGVDMVGAYGEGANPPCTPNIDGLAANGMLFRNAWANPTCSPTRASLLTGLYPFRTGIGNPVGGNEPGLSLSETLIPEMLTGYDSTAVGKWHIAGALGDEHPNDSGFGHFAGARGNIDDYFQWRKTIDGQSAQVTTYATTDTTDEAIAAIHTMQEPWFLYVAYHAPHTPAHEPPAALCRSSSCQCGTPAAEPEARPARQLDDRGPWITSSVASSAPSKRSTRTRT